MKKLTLSLQFARFPDVAAHRAALARHRVQRWIRHALARDAEITVRIVGSDEGRALNRDYRHKDYATNVLTFDYAQEPAVLADLVLCAPVVESEARALGKPLAEHYAHLIVHGTLHAQAGTTKPARPTPRPWRRVSPKFCAAWVWKILTSTAIGKRHGP